MNPTVMKFGGTSVEDTAAHQRLAAIVNERIDRLPVVVVSALRGVTDALLQSVNSASQGDPEAGMALLDPHLDRHNVIAEDLLGGEDREEINRTVQEA